MEAFSQLYQLEGLIRWGGYAVLTAIVFAETGLLMGFFLPGDSLLVTAGLLASTEHWLDVRILLALLSFAAIAGDSVGYALGYRFGRRIFNREDSRFFHKNHLRRAEKFYERHGAKTIMLARFVPIVRTFAPTIAGVVRMPYRTFITYNVVGGMGWVLSMTLTGFFLGRSIPHAERYLHWIIGAVIVVSFIPLIRKLRRKSA